MRSTLRTHVAYIGNDEQKAEDIAKRELAHLNRMGYKTVYAGINYASLQSGDEYAAIEVSWDYKNEL